MAKYSWCLQQNVDCKSIFKGWWTEGYKSGGQVWVELDTEWGGGGGGHILDLCSPASPPCLPPLFADFPIRGRAQPSPTQAQSCPAHSFSCLAWPGPACTERTWTSHCLRLQREREILQLQQISGQVGAQITNNQSILFLMTFFSSV